MLNLSPSLKYLERYEKLKGRSNLLEDEIWGKLYLIML